MFNTAKDLNKETKIGQGSYSLPLQKKPSRTLELFQTVPETGILCS